MKGDEVDLLFQKYYNDAMLYVLSFSGDPDLAEDIVSTAFYRALNTAEESIANFKYWLLRVCRNLYFDYVRRKKRIKPLDASLEDKRCKVLDTIIKNEQYQALHNAISLLEGDYKEVILLHYFENMSVREIALIIEKTESNVKVLLLRAREKLKKILEV